MLYVSLGQATSDRTVMGQQTSPPLERTLGWVTFAVMTAAAAGMLIP